jgi:hypothetical protein
MQVFIKTIISCLFIIGVPYLIGCFFEPKVYFGFSLASILTGFFLSAKSTLAAGMLSSLRKPLDGIKEPTILLARTVGLS